MKQNLFIIILFLLVLVTGYSLSPLLNPQIPNGEHIQYKVTTDEETLFTTQDIYLQEEQSGNYYVIMTNSKEQDVILHLKTFGLMPIKSFTTHRPKNGSQYSEEIVVQKNPTNNSGQIAIIGLPDLVHVLRGFPFEKGKKLDLQFIGQGGDSEMFSMKIQHLKTETIEVNGQSYEAHKLKLIPQVSGLLKVVAGLFPKTYLWYSVEQPHYLLKYQGSTGMGEGKQTIEMVRYSINN